MQPCIGNPQTHNMVSLFAVKVILSVLEIHCKCEGTEKFVFYLWKTIQVKNIQELLRKPTPCEKNLSNRSFKNQSTKTLIIF